MGHLLEETVSQRISQALNRGLDRPEGGFGGQLHIGFLGYDPARGEYLLTARTESWMRNIDGVVHGGFCAAIADHTMGIVANCLREGEQIAPHHPAADFLSSPSAAGGRGAGSGAGAVGYRPSDPSFC